MKNKKKILNKQMKFILIFNGKISKRYSENRENAYLAMKNLLASGALRQAPDPWPTSAHFTHVTSLCYVGNIC